MIAEDTKQRHYTNRMKDVVLLHFCHNNKQNNVKEKQIQKLSCNIRYKIVTLHII